MAQRRMDPERRKFITIALGFVSSLFFANSANSATKTPTKKVVKKPVVKAPVPKVVQKSATPTPKPTTTPAATPSPTPTPSASASSSQVAHTLPRGAELLRISKGPLTTSDIAIGATAISNTGERGEGQTLFVTRQSENKFIAFTAICTHQGGLLQMRPEGLKCQTHGALFNPKTGAVIYSAPRDLPEQELFIHNGTLYWVPLDQ